MARVVWKQELSWDHRPQVFTMRGFEKVVHVNLQHDNIVLWYLADPESSCYDSRTFQVFGTGDALVPADAVHLGTVLQRVFVRHVFEV